MTEFPPDLQRIPPRTSDLSHRDRQTDAIAEARLGGLDPYDPLPEDLPDWWHGDDD